MLERFKREMGTTVDAMLRQGAKELAQALPAFPDSIKPIEEIGLPGNPTSQSVSLDQGLYGYRQEQQREPEPEVDIEMG